MNSREMLTVRELAHYLRLHPTTVYRLVKAGQLPGFKIGFSWRFNSEDIERWRVRRSTGNLSRGTLKILRLPHRL